MFQRLGFLKSFENIRLEGYDLRPGLVVTVLQVRDDVEPHENFMRGWEDYKVEAGGNRTAFIAIRSALETLTGSFGWETSSFGLLPSMSPSN